MGLWAIAVYAAVVRQRLARVAGALSAVLLVAVTGCSQQSGIGTASASPSAGCQPAKPAQPGLTTASLQIGDQKREYSLNIPASYQGNKPTPLVFAFHGRGSTAQQQLILTGFDQQSNQNDFILVAPNAINGQWDLPSVIDRQTSDIVFVYTILDALQTRLCVDTTRVYASGMSLGSAMTLALACIPAPQQRFAAFGGVGASFYRAACDQAPPAPIIYFHGGKDPIVPVDGGAVKGSPRNSVTARVSPAMDNMSDWAAHNGCAATPTTTQIKTTELFDWKQGCRNNAVVQYYLSADAGHTWPGSNPTIATFLEGSLGNTTQDVNATKLMWQFFQNYQLVS